MIHSNLDDDLTVPTVGILHRCVFVSYFPTTGPPWEATHVILHPQLGGFFVRRDRTSLRCGTNCPGNKHPGTSRYSPPYRCAALYSTTGPPLIPTTGPLLPLRKLTVLRTVGTISLLSLELSIDLLLYVVKDLDRE